MIINDDLYDRKKSSADNFPYLLRLPRGISRLEKIGEHVSYPKNHVLVKAGQIPQYCYIVQRGRVISYEYSYNGEERIYNFNENNSLLLEANVLFDKISPVGFKTAKPSELIRIDKPTLMKAVTEDSQVALDIMDSLSIKFLSSMEQIRQYTSCAAPWKICNLLLIFAENYGVPYDDKILIQEKISQQLLASMLGINRITAVRAIKELKDMALIEQINGYYCIRDMERFKRHLRMLETY